MSRQGVVAPLRVSRQHAAIVGGLIEARTAAHRLDCTPFATLPAFGRKFRDAAKRRRKSGGRITIWTVQRDEALAGFHYLALFSHPLVPESFLTTDEGHMVREVTLALASALLARKGAKKLDRAAVERQLLAWHQPSTSDHDPDHPPDERWRQRLKRRVAQEDVLRRTPIRPIPAFLLGLLAPPADLPVIRP